MFVSQDMNSKKKKFQKPNILRRKSVLNKALVVRTTHKSYESQDVQSLLASSFVLDSKNNELVAQEATECTEQDFSITKSVQKTDNNVVPGLCNAQKIVENVNARNSLIYVDNAIQKNDRAVSQNQVANMGPFLIEDVKSQNIPVFECADSLNKNVKQKWCLELIQDPQKIILEHDNNPQLGSLCIDQKIPVTSVSIKSTVDQNSKTLQCKSLAPGPNSQKLTTEQLMRVPAKFKCDIPGCNTEFMSKQKFNKHMNIHNKMKNGKPPRQVTVECPVKKVHENGVEEPCGKIFHIREDLIKHLNEEHTIDEALYSCAECSRRFFWASGLRAHARSHAVRAGRAELACPWPGCARVFRQPCRLREHSRAHTGDRPYPCRYPNCGWSFRTASKLLRHARRHTGDRRHACAACGRAFLRREHLRDHADRHGAPLERARHACPHDDCEHSFTNMSSLYMHVKKVHKKEENGASAAVTVTTDNHEMTKVKADNMFVVSLLEPSEPTEIEHTAVEVGAVEGVLHEAVEGERVGEGEGDGEAEGEGEGHSARTHCTWPLSSRAQRYQHSHEYVLEEDVQVEQSEGSESNIYTVRSDLFLHGNVLHSEDSEQMARCSRLSEGEGEGEGEGEAEDERGAALALDADLLLDAPSVHLDQEELYTDAVDESSFRVFLLSGEELT